MVESTFIFIINSIGIIINSTIFFSLFTYKREGATHKLHHSIVAYVMMCMSVLTVVRLFTNMSLLSIGYDLYEAFWQGCIAVMLVRHRGNCSKVLYDPYWHQCGVSIKRSSR